MRLKIALTSLVLFSLILFGFWPWLLGNPPKTPTTGKPITKELRQAQRQYLVKSSLYFSSILISLFSTIVVSWLLARQTRDQYRADSMKNLEELIKGTLSDHEKRER